MDLPLIDMDREEWRGRFSHGEMWRSGEQQECPVCGCLSDVWVLNGGGRWPSWPGLVCLVFLQDDKELRELHWTLQKKVENLADLAHPESYVAELRREVRELSARIRARMAGA